jgi:nitroimidazol reductase NimA-like FMN-containing flavoprotein (pyridoxamine 5'-phosphate oxidase superfamily)
MDEAWLEQLDLGTCLAHLRTEPVGRIAVIFDGRPIILPINYRLVETLDLTWIALRTRPGNLIDQVPTKVSFEVDGIDPSHHRGWSVLVQGTLQAVDPDAAGFRERFDSQPWLTAEREAWLMIEPFSISGRELHPSQQDWAFHLDAYL